MNAAFELQVGKNLRRIREQRGLTQEQVSAQFQVRGCDLTRSALAKIEVGQRHIYVDELVLFAQIYRVEYRELFP